MFDIGEKFRSGKIKKLGFDELVDERNNYHIVLTFSTVFATEVAVPGMNDRVCIDTPMCMQKATAQPVTSALVTHWVAVELLRVRKYKPLTATAWPATTPALTSVFGPASGFRSAILMLPIRCLFVPFPIP